MVHTSRREFVEAVIGSELEQFFPRGSRGSRNNKLRLIYNLMRRHDLSRAEPKGANITQAESIALFEYDLQPTDWFKRENRY